MSTSGTKRPLFIDCLDDDGNPTPRLVKVVRPGLITEQNLAAELASALLASRLGLVVANTSLVAVAEPYLAAINQTLLAQGERETLLAGWAIGSEVFTGFQPIENSLAFPKALRADASVLYAFDLFSMHYDRLRENPNCGLRNGRLFVFDFDQCFPYITEPSSLYNRLDPWQVARAEWRVGHVFQSWLKVVTLDRDAVASAFSQWDPAWLEANRPSVPAEWGGTVDAIWREASRLVGKEHEFVEEVANSLL